MSTHILGRKTTYEAHAFNVQKVTIQLPDGRHYLYDLVDHKPAVTVIAVDAARAIWFVCQFRVGAGAELLELPAGVLDENEDPQAGAAREIREETGKAAGQIQKIGEFYMSAGYCNELMHVFLATDLCDDPLDADDDEFIQVQSIPVVQVYEMIAQGRLRDSKSLAALLLAQPFFYEAGDLPPAGQKR
ncbi:MAG: NUDIX hydrolase [Anaerolineaceae bacterium]|nr:NUDIX hydrolase [Anaerolineaceae bacterium]